MKKIDIPRMLQEIPDAPQQLYLRGDLPSPDDYIFLAIVGSRKYTTYGKQVCERIIKELSGHPFVIVSGLALGIDSLAHTAALEHGLLCCAVPGSGLGDQVLYPSSNRKLAQQILDAGGCLLSEFEADFTATAWSFPKRNRIMAGLCHAVLVIEAENISGTRITARLATEYNREVFAVPGSIFSTQSEGCHRLIQEGAYPATSGKNILDYFGLREPSSEEKILELSDIEQQIVSLLGSEKSRSEIQERLGISTSELSIQLSRLEIRGLIVERLGKVYRNF